MLGYGGMVALGPRRLFRRGRLHGGDRWPSAASPRRWLVWPLALVAGAPGALLIGAISLRTRGVYFIMITLAFAQMLYFVFASLRKYGGDDGYTLAARPGLWPGAESAR